MTRYVSGDVIDGYEEVGYAIMKDMQYYYLMFNAYRTAECRAQISHKKTTKKT